MILALCDRFHKLPSEVLAEDADLLNMIHVVDMGTPKEQGDGDIYGE